MFGADVSKKITCSLGLLFPVDLCHHIVLQEYSMLTFNTLQEFKCVLINLLYLDFMTYLPINRCIIKNKSNISLEIVNQKFVLPSKGCMLTIAEAGFYSYR